MKTNKIFKWLYGLFMLMPLIAIGVTCAYVTFNKNAKDNYSGEVANTLQSITSIDEIRQYDYYHFDSLGGTYIDTATKNSGYIGITEIENIYTTDSTLLGYLQQCSYFSFYYSNQPISIYCFNSDLTSIGSRVINLNDVTFDFRLMSIQTSPLSNNFTFLQKHNSDNISYLDNAFYYGVDQFNNSGFNKVDFVSYFDMFYNNTSIWTTFANTYFNYVLFVSLAFFVPRVLFWFINLAFVYADGFIERSQRW